jgi:acyl-CoA dehydrogenase-like protein
VRFDIAPEHRLFAESVRTAVGGWEPSREPDLASWLDDRDDVLSERLVEAGWQELWEDVDLRAVVAGGFELGWAMAPVCLLDEATLGAPLALGGRIRHGIETAACAVPLPGWGLAFARPARPREPERTIDGTGTVLAAIEELEPLAQASAETRWAAWTAATLAYLAGLAGAASEAAVAHARAREQFGRPLASLPAVQARLADAALAVDALALTAWHAATPLGDPARGAPALLWAGAACRDVTASAHQVHGAVGFALESGLHRFYRRAKAVQVWAAAVCSQCN